MKAIEILQENAELCKKNCTIKLNETNNNLFLLYTKYDKNYNTLEELLVDCSTFHSTTIVNTCIYTEANRARIQISDLEFVVHGNYIPNSCLLILF